MDKKQEWKLKQLTRLTTIEQQHLDNNWVQTEDEFSTIRMFQMLDNIHCGMCDSIAKKLYG